MLTRTRVSVGLAAGLAFSMALGPALQAMDVATSMVRFQSDVFASTSLRVSSSVLRLDARPDAGVGPVVVGAIDFRAAARTRRDGEVVLTVEAPRDLPTIGGPPASEDPAIGFEGIGEGAIGGVLRGDDPQVAGRWTGSGVRTGQLVFTLRGAAAAASGTVPLRFILSLP